MTPTSRIYLASVLLYINEVIPNSRLVVVVIVIVVGLLVVVKLGLTEHWRRTLI